MDYAAFCLCWVGYTTKRSMRHEIDSPDVAGFIARHDRLPDGG